MRSIRSRSLVGSSRRGVGNAEIDELRSVRISKIFVDETRSRFDVAMQDAVMRLAHIFEQLLDDIGRTSPRCSLA